MLTRYALLVVQWLSYAALAAGLQNLEAYNNIRYESPSAIGVLVSAVCLALVAFVLPSALKRPSDGVLWAFASLIVVSTLTVATTNPSFGEGTRVAAATAAMVGFVVIALVVRTESVPFAVRPDRLDRQMFGALIGALVLGGGALIVFAFGVKNFSLDFGSVYDRRLEARSAGTSIPGAGYLVEWVGNPLIPLLLCMGIYWRRNWMLIFAGGTAALLFAFSGEKSVVYSVPLILMLYAAHIRGRKGDTRPWFGLGMTALIAIPTLVGLASGSWGLAYSLPRRAGYVPGVLAAEYVEYTDSHTPTLFMHSWLKFLGADSVQGPGQAIGRTYYHADTNATASMFSDGYFSAGLIGVILVAIAGGLVIRLSNKLAISRTATVAVPVLTYSCWTLTEGYLHTTLLTGGILFALVLVWLSPDPRNRPPDGDVDRGDLSDDRIEPAATGSSG